MDALANLASHARRSINADRLRRQDVDGLVSTFGTPNFDARAFTRDYFGRATSEDAEMKQSEMREGKQHAVAALQRSVYAHHGEFIRGATEVHHLEADMLALQGAAGHGKRLHAGEHSIGFSRGHGAASLHTLAVREC